MLSQHTSQSQYEKRFHTVLRLFRCLFRKMHIMASRMIKLGDVHFFIRNAIMKISEEDDTATSAHADPQADAHNKIVLRVGRSLYKYIQKKHLGSNIYDAFTRVFRDLDENDDGILTPSELSKVLVAVGIGEHQQIENQTDATSAFEMCFALSIFGAGEPNQNTSRIQYAPMFEYTQCLTKPNACLWLGVAALTLNQELALFNAIDTDGSGTIEIGEFQAFLKTAEKMIAQRKREKKELQDPRNNLELVHAILRTVSSDIEVMIPILTSMRHAFTPRLVNGRGSIITMPTSPRRRSSVVTRKDSKSSVGLEEQNAWSACF